jgi:stage II sporulation protein P
VANLTFGGQRPRRIALAAAYVLLVSLAGLALVDLGDWLAPAAVPALADPGGPGWTAQVEPGSVAGLALRQWLAIAGRSGLFLLLEQAIPGLAPSVPATRPPRSAGGGASAGLLGYLLRGATTVSLDVPESILSAQLPGLRGVAVASRGSVQIVPDLRGEGESATPPAGALAPSRPLDPSLDRPIQGEPGSAGGPAGGQAGGAANAVPWAGVAGPVVAIYHTHARESYLTLVRQVSAAQTAKIKAEEAFAEDPDITVVRVGQELAEVLAKQHAMPTVHSRRFHDADGRLGAYVQSAQTVERLMREYPTIRVLIDLHRDSPRRAVTAGVVRGQSVAKILLVVGTNRNLAHPNWQANHDFAIRLNAAMEAMYPGLSRGIMVTESRYNQHYLPHAMLVEIGGVDNTMEEALTSTRMFAAALAAVMQADPALSQQARSGEIR